MEELRIRAQTVAAAAQPRITGEGGGRARGGDSSDRVISRIGNVHAAEAIRDEAAWLIEKGGMGGAVGGALDTGRSRESTYHAGGSDFPNRMVGGVGEENVSAGIGGDSGRKGVKGTHSRPPRRAPGP